MSDFLQTWRPPVRKVRCEPANCPEQQRARCFSQTLNRIPSAETVARISDYLAVPEGFVHWNELCQSITVETSLTQDIQCRLCHVSGFRVSPVVLKGTREWVGTFAGVGWSMNQTGIQIELEMTEGNAILLSLIKRIKGITGMLSPIGPPGDDRPSLFNRFHHVRRVATVALCAAVESQNEGSIIDLARVRRLAWLHDVNRWPFAHNGERGLYDQVADLPVFFQSNSIELSRLDTEDLKNINLKDSEKLTTEGMVVLAADRAMGIIEDLLFTITALGVDPSVVPDSVVEYTALPLKDYQFRVRLWEMRRLFYELHATGQYLDVFDRIAIAFASSIIKRYCQLRGTFEIGSGFSNGADDVRTNFQNPILFPIVNDEVSHSSFIRDKVIKPLIVHFEPNTLRMMTTIDDQQAVDLAIACGSLRREEVVKVYPDLEFIESKRPDLRFICD